MILSKAMALPNDEDDHAVIRAWIEENLGAAVEQIERTERWRPAWIVRIKSADGVARRLYVRGLREGDQPRTLKREWKVNVALARADIRIPQPHGYIEELPAIVMEAVDGRPDLGTAESDADRVAVRHQLVEQMTRMHALDTEQFRDIGFAVPPDSDAISLAFFDSSYALYRQSNCRGNASLIFLAEWVMRNRRSYCDTPTLIACDAGQFLFEGPELTAMIDLELSMLGDPMADLAALRVRGTRELLGDLPSLFADYSRVRGAPVDLDAIRYHTITFALSTALLSSVHVKHFAADPKPEGDYFEYLTWIDWSLKLAYEALTELMGWKDLPMPCPNIDDDGDRDISILRFAIELSAGKTDESKYLCDKVLALTSYLQRRLAYGPEFERTYLDDCTAILGWRPATRDAAEAALDAVVRSASPRDDERLCVYFLKDVRRRAFLLATPESKYREGLLKPLPAI